jgi:hypothetical protein
MQYERQKRAGFFFGTSLIGVMSKDGILPYVKITRRSSETVHLNTMYLLETDM